MRGTLLLVGMVLAAGMAQAKTCTWIGGNGDWFAEAGWEGGLMPEAGDDVVLRIMPPCVCPESWRAIPGTAADRGSHGRCCSRIRQTPFGAPANAFATSGSSSRASHVGIYVGGGKFVHASTSKVGVIVSGMNEAYYTSGFGRRKRRDNPHTSGRTRPFSGRWWCWQRRPRGVFVRWL